MSKQFKSGFVAIVGRPNVGKSTFMNYVLGQKIAIMSDKAQTTRNKIQGVYTNQNGGECLFCFKRSGCCIIYGKCCRKKRSW